MHIHLCMCMRVRAHTHTHSCTHAHTHTPCDSHSKQTSSQSQHYEMMQQSRNCSSLQQTLTATVGRRKPTPYRTDALIVDCLNGCIKLSSSWKKPRWKGVASCRIRTEQMPTANEEDGRGEGGGTKFKLLTSHVTIKKSERPMQILYTLNDNN